MKSLWNWFWFSLRRILRFRRAGYKESSPSNLPLPPEAQVLNERYEFSSIGPKLAPRHWLRNLATLWYLEKMLGNVQFPKAVDIIEPCCQDFSRLPALRAFFKKNQKKFHITGVEIDAYVPLDGFHSRWDHAQYYVSLENDGTRYQAEDFFKHRAAADLIICFYPFISSAPALAWGLPANVASAQKWVEAFEKNLKPGGMVLVVHQGDWEEKDFDLARINSRLEVQSRLTLGCPFFSTKHPVHATLYIFTP